MSRFNLSKNEAVFFGLILGLLLTYLTFLGLGTDCGTMLVIGVLYFIALVSSANLLLGHRIKKGDNL